MTAAVCKAALCLGDCLDSIVVDNFRELTEVAVKLATTDNLTDEQLDDLILVYEDYSSEIKRRKKADRETRQRVKAIFPELQ